ncbi:hypothetical protein H112_03123 [Trichophyton rubrum D6]|nr:hypothetical protein H112_03123 [Trichophyton rubrum D6]
MAGPQGALATSFKAVRILQAICLISIIGMTANFIAQMVNANATPPDVLIGTLSVTVIAVLYCAIIFILFLDGALPYLINLGLDGAHLIAVVVVAVTVGKPLSYLNCNVIGQVSGDHSSVYDFANALGQSLAKDGGKISYTHWIGASKLTCYEMKSIWGLSIALCILFAFSAICSACLWRQTRASAPKDIES